MSNDNLSYERSGRVTLIENILRHVPGALFTIRNMLGIDPSGGGVPDATETVKGKAELATVDEAIDGVDTTRIVTPAGLAAALAANVPTVGPTFPVLFNLGADITTATLMFSAIVSGITAATGQQFTYPSDADCYTVFALHIGGQNSTYFLSRLGNSSPPTYEYPYIDVLGVTQLVSGPSMPVSVSEGTLITVWGVSHVPLIT